MLAVMAMTQTPWGKAATVEEVTIPQRTAERRFTTVVQLLQTTDGERLVRFSYSTGGAVRRGPVTLRTQDLEKLQAALAGTPALRRVLRGGAVTR
jgi:hypothetical protein